MINPALLIQTSAMFQVAQAFQEWFNQTARAASRIDLLAPFVIDFTTHQVESVNLADTDKFAPNGEVLPFADTYYQTIRPVFLTTAQGALDAQPSTYGMDTLQEFVNTIRSTPMRTSDLMTYLDTFAPHPNYVAAVQNARTPHRP